MLKRKAFWRDKARSDTAQMLELSGWEFKVSVINVVRARNEERR